MYVVYVMYLVYDAVSEMPRRAKEYWPITNKAIKAKAEEGTGSGS